MTLPKRLKPIKVSRTIMKKKLELLEQITIKIDNGANENDKELNTMMSNWNEGVANSCEYSDFRDYNSWISAKEFTRIAFNYCKYIEDLTYGELISIIDFICNAKGKESDQSYALNLLEENFDANPSDLIYWPNEWFNNESIDDLSSEEIAAYLMEKSNRKLSDAPLVELKYTLPRDVG